MLALNVQAIADALPVLGILEHDHQVVVFLERLQLHFGDAVRRDVVRRLTDLRPLRLAKELPHVDALLLQFLQVRRIPGEPDRAGLVVHDAQFLRLDVGLQIQIRPLRHDELLAGERNEYDFLDAGLLGGLERLVAGDEPIVFVGQDRPTRAVAADGGFQHRAATLRAFIRVRGVLA